MFFGFLLMFLLVYNNQLVVYGAREGLMLWYTNILPLLLPFMLISGYIVDNSISKNSFTGSNLKNSLIAILLGVFCGYPIGAKCTADFVISGRLKKNYAGIILPLCNNLSPMFLSGYVCSNILNNTISFFILLFLIYLPYIFFTLLLLLFTKKKELKCIECINTNASATSVRQNNKSISVHTVSNNKASIHNDRILTSITQITTIGVYIMICSIIIKIIINNQYISNNYKCIISSLTEVSSGLNYVANSNTFTGDKKIALILAATSFGGLSSILQTNCVIKKSGLSIVKYTIGKLICGATTYFLTILII